MLLGSALLLLLLPYGLAHLDHQPTTYLTRCSYQLLSWFWKNWECTNGSLVDCIHSFHKQLSFITILSPPDNKQLSTCPHQVWGGGSKLQQHKKSSSRESLSTWPLKHFHNQVVFTSIIIIIFTVISTQIRGSSSQISLPPREEINRGFFSSHDRQLADQSEPLPVISRGSFPSPSTSGTLLPHQSSEAIHELSSPTPHQPSVALLTTNNHLETEQEIPGPFAPRFQVALFWWSWWFFMILWQYFFAIWFFKTLLCFKVGGRWSGVERRWYIWNIYCIWI